MGLELRLYKACFNAFSGDNQIRKRKIHALTFVFDEWLDNMGFFILQPGAAWSADKVK